MRHYFIYEHDILNYGNENSTRLEERQYCLKLVDNLLAFAKQNKDFIFGQGTEFNRHMTPPTITALVSAQKATDYNLSEAETFTSGFLFGIQEAVNLFIKCLLPIY